MLTFVSLAAALVVTVSVSGATQDSEQRVVVQARWLADDCDQGTVGAAPRFVLPGLESRLKSAEKRIAPEEEGTSSFCAMTSGPLDGNTECRFQLLA